MRVPENGPYFSALEGVSPYIDRYPICVISLLTWHQLSYPFVVLRVTFPPLALLSSGRPRADSSWSLGASLPGLAWLRSR